MLLNYQLSDQFFNSITLWLVIRAINLIEYINMCTFLSSEFLFINLSATSRETLFYFNT